MKIQGVVVTLVTLLVAVIVVLEMAPDVGEKGRAADHGTTVLEATAASDVADPDVLQLKFPVVSATETTDVKVGTRTIDYGTSSVTYDVVLSTGVLTLGEGAAGEGEAIVVTYDYEAGGLLNVVGGLTGWAVPVVILLGLIVLAMGLSRRKRRG